MTAVISVCIKKNIKISEFLCSHFNIEDGRKYATFLTHYALLFQEKHATETQKKIFAVYGEGAVIDQTCQKWFAKFPAGDFLLDNAPWSSRLVELDSK